MAARQAELGELARLAAVKQQELAAAEAALAEASAEYARVALASQAAATPQAVAHASPVLPGINCESIT